MTQDQNPLEKTTDSVTETADLSFARTLLQFFLIPAVIVAVCVSLFFFFTWAVSEERSSLDYLRDIRTGSASRRWQAAFELAKLLNHDSEKARLEGLAPQMVVAFDEAEDDDPRVRRYLALALGQLRDREAVPSLLNALSDDDPETRLYVIWALGTIGDGRAIEPVLSLAAHEDPGIRKMVVYSLGALRAHQAQPTLVAALEDATLDVAWNAAIALAQLGDGSGRNRLLQMLDREFLESVETMTAEQRAQTMMAAIQAAVLVSDQVVRDRIELISKQDPNLKVRQAAFEGLSAIDKTAQK